MDLNYETFKMAIRVVGIWSISTGCQAGRETQTRYCWGWSGL